MNQYPSQLVLFFVYDWIQEKYPNEVEVIAKGTFGGKVIIIPTNKGEIK